MITVMSLQKSFCVYEDRYSSEIAGEYDSLEIAMREHPWKLHAEIVRNGIVYAIGGPFGWLKGGPISHE